MFGQGYGLGFLVGVVGMYALNKFFNESEED